MWKIIKILAVLLIVVVSFFIVRFMYRANTGQLVSNQGNVEISDWKIFVPPSGDFKILFPVEPRHTNNDSQDVKRDAYRVVNKGIGYSVNVAKYPFGKSDKSDPTQVKEILEAGLEASLVPGETISSKNITNFGKYPAIDYIKTINQAGVINEKGKMVLVEGEKDSTLYFLTVLYRDNFDDKFYNTFVDSFEIQK